MKDVFLDFNEIDYNQSLSLILYYYSTITKDFIKEINGKAETIDLIAIPQYRDLLLEELKQTNILSALNIDILDYRLFATILLLITTYIKFTNTICFTHGEGIRFDVAEDITCSMAFT